jgi:hypothetical protein
MVISIASEKIPMEFPLSSFQRMFLGKIEKR